MSGFGEKKKLKPADVARLLHDPSEVNRARLARKIGTGLTGEALSPSERAVAEELIRMFAADTVVQVRIALAESVKSNSALPRDVARKLAQDVAEVSLPILQFSQSLTDKDLIEIVRSGDAMRQTAIACRSTVSMTVSGTVIEHAERPAVVALFRNSRAEIADPDFDRAMDRFDNAPSVAESIATRDRLPPKIAKRLAKFVSESVRTHLEARYNLTQPVMRELVTKARDRAAKVLYAGDASSSDPFLHARELAARKKLSSQFVLSRLCLGDIPFVEASLAVLAEIPLSNARLLLHDSGALGLRSLLKKAEIPSRLLPSFRLALAFAKEPNAWSDDEDFQDRRRAVATHIIETFADCRHEEVDHLLGTLERVMPGRDGPAEIVHYAGAVSVA